MSYISKAKGRGYKSVDRKSPTASQLPVRTMATDAGSTSSKKLVKTTNLLAASKLAEEMRNSAASTGSLQSIGVHKFEDTNSFGKTASFGKNEAMGGDSLENVRQGLDPLRHAMYPRLYTKYAKNKALNDRIAKHITATVEPVKVAEIDYSSFKPKKKGYSSRLQDYESSLNRSYFATARQEGTTWATAHLGT